MSVRAVPCVDVGSTFTKGVLVDPATGALLATASAPTTSSIDVLEGLDAVVDALTASAGAGGVDVGLPLVCSSAGGGLRVAVVGYERQVTAEAGRRVALSAGGKVVHVAAGRLDGSALAALAAAAPDLVLLVGGTDGGNAEVLRHNAARLSQTRMAAPIVVAGNSDARAEVGEVLASTGGRHVLADNVVPRIGVIAPGSARAAIRRVFLEHVIGGKGLSQGPRFAQLVQAPTPDAVLRGVEVLAEVAGQDVLVVDVGGATTDVYSVITPEGEDAALRKEVVAPLWHARTVEADLGLRWSAPGVVEAAEAEGLPLTPTLASYAGWLASHPAHLPGGASEAELDRELARLAALVAVRRHGRPESAGGAPRPLAAVGLVLGSGGQLRHDAEHATGPGGVLDVLLGDHAGGWPVPRHTQSAVDTAYLLFAVGLLADPHPEAARALATGLGDGVTLRT